MDIKIILGFIALTILLTSIVGFAAWGSGYRAALKDYMSGNIDCIIRVQHPDLLERK